MTTAPGGIDFRSIDRFLLQERHLRPWELERLTLPEMMLYLEKPDQAPPGGGQAVASQDELIAYARWWRSLTPRQRLEQAR